MPNTYKNQQEGKCIVCQGDDDKHYHIYHDEHCCDNPRPSSTILRMNMTKNQQAEKIRMGIASAWRNDIPASEECGVCAKEAGRPYVLGEAYCDYHSPTQSKPEQECMLPCHEKHITHINHCEIQITEEDEKLAEEVKERFKPEQEGKPCHIFEQNRIVVFKECNHNLNMNIKPV